MHSRTRGLSDAEPQFQVARQREAVDQPASKCAEDPSLLSVGQDAGDPRFQVGSSAPATDQASSKAAEDPSAASW